MIRFLLGSLTGWAAVLVAGIVIALPYILRSTRRNAAERAPSGGVPVRERSLRARMWPHYWLGYGLAGLIVAHTSFVMGPVMGRSDAVGIWAATLAFGALFQQVCLGLVLKSENTRHNTRCEVRQWHFWSMIGFLALVLTHVLRNG